MIVWTPAVLGVLYACVLYFCICTCSVQLSMFHMERCSRNTLIIIIIIIESERDREAERERERDRYIQTHRDILRSVGQEPVAKQILRRKWGWIGHTLRKPASSTTHQALTWNPQGKRKRGRSRNSWRRDTEAELKQQWTKGPTGLEWSEQPRTECSGEGS